MDSGSQTGNASSSGSAWGGFLKKAMEGVEQHLDRVLENPPPKGPPPSFTSANLVAREAALAAAKKDGQNKNVGAAGRMTLQERLAASIAKSRTGSPKTGETDNSTVEDGGEENSN